MKVDKPIIKIEITPRELSMVAYCISELLTITNDMDIERGFDLNRQDECEVLLEELNKVINIVRGDA